MDIGNVGKGTSAVQQHDTRALPTAHEILDHVPAEQGFILQERFTKSAERGMVQSGTQPLQPPANNVSSGTKGIT